MHLGKIFFYIFPQDFYFENFQIHRKVDTMNILLLFLYMGQLVLCHICSLSLYSYRPFLPNPFENKLQTSSTSSLTHQCVSRKTMDIFPKSHNTTVTPKKDDINSVKLCHWIHNIYRFYQLSQKCLLQLFFFKLLVKIHALHLVVMSLVSFNVIEQAPCPFLSLDCVLLWMSHHLDLFVSWCWHAG